MEEKKYRVVAKISDDKFVRYHVNDLIKFSAFLDKSFPGWRWFNVYHYNTRIQIANYTNKDRPVARHV